MRRPGRCWMTNLLLVRFRSDSAQCVCIFILRHTTITVRLFAGIGRNLGGMSEPFHMNDTERKKEREGREEKKKNSFTARTTTTNTSTESGTGADG